MRDGNNVIVLVHVLCIIAGWYFGAKKGRALFGFLLGSLFSVLGLIILMFFPERRKEVVAQPDGNGRYCRRVGDGRTSGRARAPRAPQGLAVGFPVHPAMRRARGARPTGYIVPNNATLPNGRGGVPPLPTGGGGAPSLPSFATASNVNDPSSDDQDERVKTFGKAPVIVKVVSVILIVESVGGFLMNLMSNPGTKFVGWGVGLAVRIVIACAVARGSRGARDFLIAIGALALIAGALMLHCFDPADFGGKETGFAMKFLGGGIFNLLMGLLLCTRSAREWLKPR